MTCGSALQLGLDRLHLLSASRPTFMKISSSTPCFHCWVPWSTVRDTSRIPPNRNSEIATVMMPAIVISRLRRSEISVSRTK